MAILVTSSGKFLPSNSDNMALDSSLQVLVKTLLQQRQTWWYNIASLKKFNNACNGVLPLTRLKIRICLVILAPTLQSTYNCSLWINIV